MVVPLFQSSHLRRGAAILTLLSLPGLSHAADSQTKVNIEEPADPAKAQIQEKLDQQASEEALQGWWTEARKNLDERLAWWRDARFGVFIHWGVYANPAGEWKGKKGGSYSEHIMRQMKIPLKVYREEVAAVFNPEKYDADAWADLFARAGMKYVVITAKHHDGFAMWPSKVGNFDIEDVTPFKRDPMKELANASRKRGLKFGFYYSHAFDWEHPNAAGNDWDYENPGGDRLLGGKNWFENHPEWLPRIRKYVDEKAIPQLLELIHDYHPDILWFDTPGKLPFSEQIRIVKAVRQADPYVVINGRAARGGTQGNWGDYLNTADNPAEVRATNGDWESIPTVNSSYGYNKMDKKYKSSEFFVQLLAKTTAKGGNTLLNVGPMGNGVIDPEAQAILEGMARWMQVNQESIQGTVRTPLDRQAWGDSTRKGNRLYLHVFDWPKNGKLAVGGLRNKITTAYFLADAGRTPLDISRINEEDLVVTVPRVKPDASPDIVVVLECEGEPQTIPGRLLATNIETNRLLAFDAAVHGKLNYGDGKQNKYYVTGFGPGENISWAVRAPVPARFKVSVRFSTEKKEGNGVLQIRYGDQSLTTQVAPPNSTTEVELGELNITPEQHELSLQVPENTADLNVLELRLQPVKAADPFPR